MAEVLGLHPDQWTAAAPRDLDATVAALVRFAVQQRALARDRKDYAASDAIRDLLGEAGVRIEDTPAGTTWTLALPVPDGRRCPRPLNCRGTSR